jgi:hypothetical protein
LVAEIGRSPNELKEFAAFIADTNEDPSGALNEALK